MCFFGKKKKAAKKAEEERKALEAKRLEEEKKAEEERKVLEAKKLEEERKALEAKKAEEAKKVETPKKAAPKKAKAKKEEPKEVKVETKSEIKEERKEEVKEVAPKKGRYNGKIIIYKDGEAFRFVLKASNGEVLCTSETYASKQSVSTAIETFKQNVGNGSFSVYEDKHKQYQYFLHAKNNRIIVVGEIYQSYNSCLSAIESVKKFAATADVSFIDEDIKGHYSISEEEFNAQEVQSATNGKIEVLMEENKYYYTLKASNGVLLFTSKTYASRNAALASVENFKQLLSLNKFKIYKDKNNIFVFKIYNKVNALMIVGEHYDSLAKCKSALTSVVKFGKEAKVIE